MSMWARVSFGAGLLRSLFIAVAALVIQLPVEAVAKSRLALVVGVGSYREEVGKLLAPPSDADQMKTALESRGIGFTVQVLKDDDVKDKAAFEAALKAFVAKIRPDDEVVFYFSGHGFNHPERGNFFLLPDAKWQTAYLQGLSASEKSELDNDAKRETKYRDWIANISISETDVEKTLQAAKPSVLVIIADACRNQIGKANKGLVPVASNLTPPSQPAMGTFRLYSASRGQVSLDSPERRPSARTATMSDRKDDKRETSLFTRVLLQKLQEPRLEINVLASMVKIEVRKRAIDHLTEQIPDFQDSRNATDFYFRSELVDLADRCRTAPDEMAKLHYGVSLGSISRDELERKRGELAPCGDRYVEEINKLLVFERQGAGALSASSQGRVTTLPDSGDPVQMCDVNASSPFDPNRSQDVSGAEVQVIALAALSKPAQKPKAVTYLKKLAESCEAAAKERPRVARYKFNLGRINYALATLASDKDNSSEKQASLVQASRGYQEAADTGYVASFNDLALMHQNGEYFEIDASGLKRMPPDRKKAFNYLKRGADLGHVLALYNLGMAYKNGELGIETKLAETQSDGTPVTTENTRQALALQNLSRAAEGGYVPAMIETAILLHNWPGIKRDVKRAADLLEVAASRGSWEAMYVLGQVHRININPRDELLLDSGQLKARTRAADAEAFLWHSRAAEAGNTSAQTALAAMLLDGTGLPAPQPDAAGRYLRLAAEAGSMKAQMLLAKQLKDGKIPFRPRIDNKMDGGAAEIRYLYKAAFERGSPEAGLELAKLYRTGFPVEHPSDVIPKSSSEATKLLWDTIDKVRSANPSTSEADPRWEALAAAEMIAIYDSGEAKGTDINADQIEQLKSEYGDVGRYMFIRTSAVGAVNCRNHEFWAMVWDAKRGQVPTDAQFDWFERYNSCKLRTAAEKEQEKKKKKEDGSRRDKPVKDADLGVPKKTRDVFKREFEAWLKDSEQKDKKEKRSFVDRMVAIATRERKGRSNDDDD